MCVLFLVPIQLASKVTNDEVRKADFKEESITNKRVSSFALKIDVSLSTPDLENNRLFGENFTSSALLGL